MRPSLRFYPQVLAANPRAGHGQDDQGQFRAAFRAGDGRQGAAHRATVTLTIGRDRKAKSTAATKASYRFGPLAPECLSITAEAPASRSKSWRAGRGAREEGPQIPLERGGTETVRSIPR